MNLINTLKFIEWKHSKNPIKLFLYKWDRSKKSIKIKKYFKKKRLKEINKFVKSELHNIEKKYRGIKNKIYSEVRNRKIKKNKLLSMKGYEIEVKKQKKGIPFISKKIKSEYTGLYFGYGNVGKLIEIPTMNNNSFNLFEKELHGFKDTETKEETFFIEGKRLLFINKDSIFLPKLDFEDKKFIYDITPEYFYSYVNNVVDHELTKPTKQGAEGLEGLVGKYWKILLAGAIALGIYLMQSKGGSP